MCVRQLLLFGCLVVATSLGLAARESVAPKDFLWRTTGPAPSPKENPATAEKVELGKQLFFDPRLSGNNKISCATCHDPKKAFADGLSRGKGISGKPLPRNTPSLLNVGFYKTLHWDGKVRSLEEQALLPIQHPDEMGQNLDELEAELNAVPGYVNQFQKVFGTKVTRTGIAQALAAFQRTLVTGKSPFDRYLEGDKKALSPLALEGMRIFFGPAECSRCHSGPFFTDQQFYRVGASFRDPGRENITGKKEDRFAFRTPTLRNIALTPPYMHDGSARSLHSVVTFYYRDVPTKAPLGLEMHILPLMGQSLNDVAPLVAFLESLTGPMPEIEPPKLP
ncbi:MAG: cytochrome-c peroxidase [Gemmatales bacterium]|nr:MAG: cytochrome-c peroxidase [Gemmatales bacterium]